MAKLLQDTDKYKVLCENIDTKLSEWDRATDEADELYKKHKKYFDEWRDMCILRSDLWKEWEEMVEKRKEMWKDNEICNPDTADSSDKL